MNGENEREEYSDEMGAGERLEAEISKIFSEDTGNADDVTEPEGGHGMPVPSGGGLPKKIDSKTKPVPKKQAENEEKPISEAPKMPKKEKKKARGSAHYAVILVLLLLCALAFCALAVGLSRKYAEDMALSEGQESEENGESTDAPTDGGKIVFVHPDGEESGLLALPELYETYAPSVVSIRTQGKNGSGIGSGFFLREDGYLATAAHVVEGAERITAVTSDGKSFAASLVASEATTDLALLKIEGSGFSAVQFGSSKDLLTGERVVAIGTPASLDYAGTLSSGEISYGLRTVKIYDSAGQILQKKMKLIQTNVPLNAGNSGCPLFDGYGHVVGIVTMKLGAGVERVGFAIPSDGAAEILGRMLRGEALTEEVLAAISVSAPRLGVVGESGESDGIAGVRILQFSSGTCDAAIKLREGDLIIAVDEEPVATTQKLTSLVQNKNPGDGVLVSVLRSGQRLTFEVILEKS